MWEPIAPLAPFPGRVHPMLTVRLALLAGLFAAFAPPPVAAQPPADDVARVVALWGRRQAIPVARYAVRSESVPADAKPGDARPAGGVGTGSATLTLDGPGGRLRLDRDELIRITNRREPVSRTRTTLRYDGRDQWYSVATDYDPATAPAEPAYERVYISAWGLQMRWAEDFDPLLWGHGFIPGAQETPSPFGPPSPARFRAAGREAVGGRDCVVLRDTAAAETLWVDAERGSVARRRFEWKDGGVGETAVTYQETPHGWLPLAWEESYAKAGRPLTVRRRFRVEAVAFAPPVTADDFRIALPPGTILEKHGRSYRVRADGSLEAAVADRPPSALARWFDAAGWPGLAGLAAAVTLMGVLVRLRRHGNPPPEKP